MRFNPRNMAVIIGENNVGKSNLIRAIDLFLNLPSRQPHTKDDFCNKANDIEIEVIFSDVSEVAKEELEDYLDEEKRLKIEMKFPFLENKKIIVVRNGEDVEVPRGVLNILKKYLPEFIRFEALRNVTEETKIKSTTSFGKLIGLMLNEIPEEEKDELNEKLKEIEAMLNEEEKFEAIKNLEDNLRTKLNEQIPIRNMNLRVNVPTLDTILRNVVVEIDDGVLTRVEDKGTGLQSSFILASMMEFAERGVKKSVIFGMEEPENDLHPHAQRQMYETLQTLSEKGYQVFVTTHSPFFVNEANLYDLILMKKTSGGSTVRQIKENELSNLDLSKIERNLDAGNSEMFFAKCVLLVEGDTEKFTIPIFASKVADTDNPSNKISFDKLGISVVGVGGKDNFVPFLNVLKKFNIKSVVMRDSDAIDIDLNGLCKRIKTLSSDFEGILTEKGIDKILNAIDEIEQEGEKNNLRDKLIGEIKGIDRAMFAKIIEAMKSDKSLSIFGEYINQMDLDESKIIRGIIAKYLRNHSKPRLGRRIAEKFEEEDIPNEFKDVISEVKNVASLRDIL